MFKTWHTKAQAATELAVFGAIVIFILGSIVRSAVGNSYTQNESLKTMRMAMLESWRGSQAGTTARNSASVLFVEDRLSPDFNKYGALDRNPYMASGAGTFSYMLLYPLNPNEVSTNLSMMDVYINGQYFPFTTAAWVASRQICQPGVDPGCAACPAGASAISSAQAQQNCLVPCQSPSLSVSAQQQCAASCAFAAQQQCMANQCLRNQREWVASGTSKFKLFYTIVANPGGNDNSAATPVFSQTPPSCADPNTVACKDQALSSTLQLPDAVTGQPFTNDGAMEYDLLRMGDYASVDAQFPVDAPTLRPYLAWQWAATAGTVQGNSTDGADPMIGLAPDNNQYPTYDIDGRLKEVTIYAISMDNATGDPIVSYEDFQGGDIDTTWDTNSCNPKPGLQSTEQIYTFTQGGTYLQIKEGQLYNPETGQVVRSQNMRDTIDLIQRTIQLSNNTGRFCSIPASAHASVVPCAQACSSANPTPAGQLPCSACASPNPVEVCADESSPTDNCFNGTNFVQTCYDVGSNIIYVRSRLEDRRGNFWMTNASGQLKVQ